MIGIYKFTNLKNNKVYIGQSVNITNRRLSHKSNAFNKTANDYNSQFHMALRKYGVENFSFEIIEECDKSELSNKEKEWIKYYDSYKNGYNATPGGEYGVSQPHEKNGRALLTLDDVIDIRTKYNDKIPFRYVYEKYKNKISKRGLQKVWHFETWKDVMPEAKTLENKEFHNTRAKAMSYHDVHNSIFTEEEITLMREAKRNGIEQKEYYNINFLNKCSYSAFERMWNRKDICPCID